MRLILLWLRPVTFASERVDRCVAPSGRVSKVRTSTRSTSASLRGRGVAGRGSSSPSRRRRTTRMPPLANHGPGDLHPASHLGVAPAFGTEQHDTGAQGQCLRHPRAARPSTTAVVRRGPESRARAGDRSHALPPAHRCRKSRYLYNEYQTQALEGAKVLSSFGNSNSWEIIRRKTKAPPTQLSHRARFDQPSPESCSNPT
jgi:hypothetical protein